MCGRIVSGFYGFFLNIATIAAIGLYIAVLVVSLVGPFHDCNADIDRFHLSPVNFASVSLAVYAVAAILRCLGLTGAFVALVLLGGQTAWGWVLVGLIACRQVSTLSEITGVNGTLLGDIEDDLTGDLNDTRVLWHLILWSAIASSAVFGGHLLKIIPGCVREGVEIVNERKARSRYTELSGEEPAEESPETLTRMKRYT